VADDATDYRNAKSENLKGLHGEILQENAAMLKMCQGLGFQIKTNAEDRGLREARLTLNQRPFSLNGTDQ
jgi:hypothetical protein